MFATATAIILSSCQKNEIYENEIPKADDGKIKFSSIQGLSTKAADGYVFNNTQDLRNYGSFVVQGFGSAATALEGLKYVDAVPTYNGNTWEYDKEVYWPQQTLDFFAYAPLKSDLTLSATANNDNIITKDAITLNSFQVGANNAQIDFVVAKEIKKSKENRTMLTFKHALTQIAFKAMVIDENGSDNQLQVEVEDVSLVNIWNQASYKWNIGDGTTMKQNVWTKDGGSSTVKLTEYPYISSTTNSITAKGALGSVANAQLIGTNKDVLLMIPQNFSAWDTKTKIADSDGAYVKLYAKIWVRKDLGLGEQDVVLHGTYDSGDKGDAANYNPAVIYIPVSSLGDVANDVNNAPLGQWVPGRRINYVITFGDKTSGSGGGGWTDYDKDQDPEQVLVPIRFTATVEDWVNQDVPLLSATVEGNSSAPLSATFVQGYTDRVMTDIKGSQFPKTFNATVKVTSTNSADFGNFTLDVNSFTNSYAYFRPASTFTWSFTAPVWGSITLPAAPQGWVWKAGTPGTVTANGSVTMVKIAENNLTWSSFFSDVDQHTVAIQKNIQALTQSSDLQLQYAVESKAAAISEVKYFETGYLNNIQVATSPVTRASAVIESSITYDFSAVKINGGGKILMNIPAGWNLDESNSSNAIKSADGQSVSITNANGGIIIFVRDAEPTIVS